MKKLVLISILGILAVPLGVLAQTTSVTSAIQCYFSGTNQLYDSVSCLNSRIDSILKELKELDKRVSALESRSNTAIPGTPVGSAVPGTPIGIPATPTVSSNSGATSVGTVQQGVTSEAVKAVQTFLKAEGSFVAPQATGYFGSITKNAVLNFQATQGLTQTGVVDQATLGKIQTLAPQIAPSTVPTLQQIQTSQVKPQ